jgi:hypothetical protein
MPDFLYFVGVSADLSGVRNATVRKKVAKMLPTPEDTEFTWGTLTELLEEALALAPAMRADIVYGAFDALYTLVRVHDGRIDELSVRPSLSKARYTPVDPSLDRVPRVEVEGDADALADALGPEAEGIMADEGLLHLPAGWRDVPTMGRALTLVAGAMRKPREAFLFRAGDNHYVAELERGVGVRLRPTWPWVEDGTKEDRAAFARVLPPSEHPPFPWGELQPAQRFTSKNARVAGKPFTSGAARSRLGAITDADLARNTRPLPVEALLEALASPENAGPAFAEVRRKLYSVVSHVERADVLQAVREALRVGLRDEPEDVATFVGDILWRQKPLLERLVREDLLPAWSQRPDYARRIVHAAREAYLEIPESWLPDAPPQLQRALAGLLVTGR